MLGFEYRYGRYVLGFEYRYGSCVLGLVGDKGFRDMR